MGDPQVVTPACDQFAGCRDQPGGVQPSGVDDEPNLVRDEVFDRRVQLLQERGRIALGAVFGPRLAEDQHRDLGEIVAGEHVDPAGSGPCRPSPTRGPRRSQSSSRCGRGVVLVRVLQSFGRSFRRSFGGVATHTVPSNPASPDGCCSVSSRIMVSPSVAVTRAV